MKCPNCQHPDSKVVDSRVSNEADQIRRRRECEQCSFRFTTYERIEDALPMVIKKDGRRDIFDEVKLLNGIKKACEKRPVSTDDMGKLVKEIENNLQEKGLKEVSSTDIGELVMIGLKKLDDVAYVRFASVYRSFKDINEFINEVERVLKR